MPGLTRYGYREVIGGFFEFPTENARRILPGHIEPAELHHGTSIFAMNVFDFTESMVGAYKEAVMAVIVAPLVKPGERLPKSAFYPYLVATTTRAAREHAIERWHLPHWMSDVEIGFEPGPGRLTARVGADGAPVADMTITEHSWSPVSHLYQSFMRDGDQTYLAHITMEGKQSEHEDEKGLLKLYDHPFNQQLVISEVYETPFRELWMLAAAKDVEEKGALPVPLHLRNAPTALMEKLGYGKDYKYAHNYADAIVDQEHLPKELAGRKYYSPSESGHEKEIKERLRSWEQKKKAEKG